MITLESEVLRIMRTTDQRLVRVRAASPEQFYFVVSKERVLPELALRMIRSGVLIGGSMSLADYYREASSEGPGDGNA